MKISSDEEDGGNPSPAGQLQLTAGADAQNAIVLA